MERKTYSAFLLCCFLLHRLNAHYEHFDETNKTFRRVIVRLFFLIPRAHDRKMKSINAETINSSSTFFVMDISIGRTSLLLASRSTILPLYLPDCDM